MYMKFEKYEHVSVSETKVGLLSRPKLDWIDVQLRRSLCGS